MRYPMLALQQLYKAARNVEDSLLRDIKRVYFGDPVQIPESECPAIVIAPTETEYIKRGSVYDQKNHTIDVKLIYNQKQYYNKGVSSPISITGASIEPGGKIKFESALHGLAVGDAVEIAGVMPTAFNGTFYVEAVPDENYFIVDRVVGETFVSGGEVRTKVIDKVMSVEDAIMKSEGEDDTDEGATNATSIAGMVQANSQLPYRNPQGISRNTAVTSGVQRVQYLFSVERGFPTYEVITTIGVTVVGNRKTIS